MAPSDTDTTGGLRGTWAERATERIRRSGVHQLHIVCAHFMAVVCSETR